MSSARTRRCVSLALLPACARSDCVLFSRVCRAVQSRAWSGEKGFRLTLVHDVGGVGEQHLELLHYACEYGHMELIAFLIHQGVDIFVPDADGGFPPSLALALSDCHSCPNQADSMPTCTAAVVCECAGRTLPCACARLEKSAVHCGHHSA